MATPLVSVILPTYNRVHLLQRSIKSVLDQSFRNLELIIVDDGSTDNTAEVVGRMSDDRIRYFNTGANKGAPFARNLGIRQSTGHYMAFQDSDDEWSNEKLEKQTRLLSSSSDRVGLVYSGYWMIKGNRMRYMPPPSVHPRNGDLHSVLLAGNFITTQTALVRKECLLEAGMFDEGLPRLQEWELWLRISKHHEFAFIDEPLVTAYLQPDSITSDPRKLVNAFEMILRKHGDDFARHRKALAHVYYLVGSQLLSSGRTLTKEKIYLRQAFRIDPTKMRYLLLALSSFLGKMWLSRAAAMVRRVKSLVGR